jgi:hypothetical protein
VAERESGLAPLVLGRQQERSMILLLVFVLLALWVLGMVTTTTLGGWLHVLLVVAIVFLLIRVIRGQPV